MALSIALVGFAFAFAFASCAPADPVEPEFHDASGIDGPVHVEPEEVQSVALGWDVDRARLVVEAPGVARVKRHDGLRGRFERTLSAEKWLDIRRRVHDIPFSDHEDVSFPGADETVVVHTVDGRFYRARGGRGDEASPLSELIEVVRRVSDGEFTPVGGTRDVIVSVELREQWDAVRDEYYHVRLNREGRFWKDDQRRKGTQARGVFTSKVLKLESGRFFEYLEVCDLSPGDRRPPHPLLDYVQYSFVIERADGTEHAFTSGEYATRPDLFVAIQAIKGLDAEAEWEPE